MTKYKVAETVACWVTFTRWVEADSQESAVAAFRDGEGEGEETPEIGDSLDGYDSILEVDGTPYAAEEEEESGE